MFSALAALLLTAQPAPQPDPAIESDIRCVAAMTVVMGAVPEAQQAQIIAGTMYFIGRLDAAAPDLDLEAALLRVVAPIEDPNALKPDIERCGAILESRGAQLRSIGEALQNHTKKQR